MDSVILELESSHERGSLSPLIFGYFIILMAAAFAITDISAVYIDRRELISNTEAALYRATGELDRERYYLGTGPTTAAGNKANASNVPIDCDVAWQTFRNDIPTEAAVMRFSCDGRKVSATVEREKILPFQFRIMSLLSFTNRIEATVVAEYLF